MSLLSSFWLAPVRARDWDATFQALAPLAARHLPARPGLAAADEAGAGRPTRRRNVLRNG